MTIEAKRDKKEMDKNLMIEKINHYKKFILYWSNYVASKSKKIFSWLIMKN